MDVFHENEPIRFDFLPRKLYYMIAILLHKTCPPPPLQSVEEAH
jgi:hypothetical protein